MIMNFVIHLFFIPHIKPRGEQTETIIIIITILSWVSSNNMVDKSSYTSEEVKKVKEHGQNVDNFG